MINQDFVTFKKAFTSSPILDHPNKKKPYPIKADASDFACGSV